MSTGKYIVGTVADGFFNHYEVAILFPNFVSHGAIADKFFTGDVVSGGFYVVNGEEVTVYGKAISARTHSRAEDAKLIRKTLGFE